MYRLHLFARLRRHAICSWALVLLLLFKVSIAAACQSHEVHAMERGDTTALVTGVDSSTDVLVTPADPDHGQPSNIHHAACTHCGCCAHAFAISTGPCVLPVPASASRLAMFSVPCPGGHEEPGLRPPIV